MDKIVTNFVYPPIPIRDFDWCARIDGREEEGPYGWGRTKELAVQDLMRKIDENETEVVLDKAK